MPRLAEAAAYVDDGLNQRIVGNDPIRPHGCEQFLLRHKPPSVDREISKDLIRPRAHLNHASVPVEQHFASKVERMVRNRNLHAGGQQVWGDLIHFAEGTAFAELDRHGANFARNDRISA